MAADGLTSVCLLGMGGSSLCAEVLRLTLAPADRMADVHVLDTTDERAIAHASRVLSPATTLFIVASKSGSTIEVTALEAYFRTWVTTAGIRIQATLHRDYRPGTAMVAHAAAHAYRHTFINPADIGGRFSALSLFGLVPRVDGHDPARCLWRRAMVNACRTDDEENPGLGWASTWPHTPWRGATNHAAPAPVPVDGGPGTWGRATVARARQTGPRRPPDRG